MPRHAICAVCKQPFILGFGKQKHRKVCNGCITPNESDWEKVRNAAYLKHLEKPIVEIKE